MTPSHVFTALHELQNALISLLNHEPYDISVACIYFCKLEDKHFSCLSPLFFPTVLTHAGCCSGTSVPSEFSSCEPTGSPNKMGEGKMRRYEGSSLSLPFWHRNDPVLILYLVCVGTLINTFSYILSHKSIFKDQSPIWFQDCRPWFCAALVNGWLIEETFDVPLAVLR